MNLIVSSSRCIHSIFIILSAIDSKYTPKKYLCLISQKRKSWSVRLEKMTCATMVIKGLEKFLETQPDIVQQKMFQRIFYFYLCCLWNEYCIVGSVDFISDTISSHPQSLPSCQNWCAFEEATFSEQEKRARGLTKWIPVSVNLPSQVMQIVFWF